MKKGNEKNVKGIIGVIGIISILTLVVFMSGCTSWGMSESDYKAACKEVPVSELLNNPDQYVGQKIKVTGNILLVSVDGLNNTKTNMATLVGVEDPTHILSTGIISVSINYENLDDYPTSDNRTFYGEFYVDNTTYNSVGAYNDEVKSKIGDKRIPQLKAEYYE